MNTKTSLIFNNTFKIILSLLLISIFMTNCEKEESIFQEPEGYKTIFKVSFNDFTSEIANSKKLQKIKTLTDIYKAKSNTVSKIDSTSQITILTDEITMIVKDSISTYTFEVTTNEDLENNEFYNLVIYINNNTQNIYKSYFLEYFPSDGWLTDTSQQFTGGVKLINNDFFDTDNLFQSKAGDDCVTGVNTNWECSYGNEHSPSTGPPQCVATNFTFWITLETGSCIESSTFNIPSGGGQSTGGPSGGNTGNDDGIPDDDDSPKILTSTTGGGASNPNEDECTQSDETFNYFYSSKSPFNVDLSEVRPPCDDNIDTSEVEANEKFMCIYKKLTESTNFKNLFVDTFGESVNLNVKFELDDSLPNNVGGVTGADPDNPSEIIDGELYLNLRIRINKNHLNEGHLAARSTISIAKNILHECIHTYLYVKKYNCNDGTTFDILDNQLLGELINEYYDGSCSEDQEQHEFMFDFMIPTMSQVLANVKNDLIPESNQNYVSDLDYNNSFWADNPFTESHIFNWTEFYKYLSMEGLHITEAFQQGIVPNPIENYLFERYNDTSDEFSKDYCNEE